MKATDATRCGYDIEALAGVAQDLIAELRVRDDESMQRLERATVVVGLLRERAEALNLAIENLEVNRQMQRVGHLDAFDSEHRQ